jgi:hypothetical protein
LFAVGSPQAVTQPPNREDPEPDEPAPEANTPEASEILQVFSYAKLPAV